MPDGYPTEVDLTTKLGRGLAGAREERDTPQLWPLAAVSVVVVLLALAGALPQWPGLPHFVALPPADLHADLRVLLTRAPSVPAFVALLAVVLAVRVVVLCLLLGGLTWRRARFAALFYAVAALPLLLAAQLEFMASALLYSRLFWAAMTLLALTWFLTAPMPWQREERLRTAFTRSWRHGLRVEVLIPYALVLILLGVLADNFPVLTIPLIPVSALATGVAITFLARPAPHRPLRRLAAAALALAVAGTVFTVTRGAVDDGPVPEPREGSVLLMSGINSASGRGAIFETDIETLGYTCEQTFYFSYSGPGDGQPRGVATCPITTGAPYTPEDTQRPLAEQVEIFAEQIADLPRPLVVAGHSQAVWVVWQALASGVAPEVDAALFVGPFPQSPVGYPAADDDGEGRVAGDLLRLLIPLADLVDFDFDPDAPLAQEILATPDAASSIIAEPLPDDVRSLSMTSATDLPLMPDGWHLPVDRNACPMRVAHPYLPIRAVFHQEVNRFLDGRPALDCPAWRDWGAPVSRPFGTPPQDP
ncbi:hypothetical protein PJ985_06395 [Streptomyces sp. ACA25]|uniref:hypothetical protein n=1 Tax=Streptomyces sp. ACA25 TaxID=3022596 RepID=UPI0023076B5F|nr:hypothetical protein [Streptomyces sp. ACA25]MDB1087198.1 hypothetical protein [Streptomyces sp. ACA25]